MCFKCSGLYRELPKTPEWEPKDVADDEAGIPRYLTPHTRTSGVASRLVGRLDDSRSVSFGNATFRSLSWFF